MSAEPAAPLPIDSAPSGGNRLTRGLSRNVLALGAVSLFTDISSEMISPVRILFLVFVLGTPLPIAGTIEGIAESSSSILKVFSGWLADRVERRKPVIVTGYALSNCMKPLLALAGSWTAALGLIVVDRFGKGLRTSPRDAVLAESALPEYRGKAFGLHRGMDTLGAAIGPLFAVAILAVSHGDLRAVFAWTALPGAIAVVVAFIFLREVRHKRPAREPAARLDVRKRAASLGAPFWIFTAIATLFSLGNSSDAFIFLRTEGLEQSLEAVPLIFFVFNLVYALLAVPLGSLSDRRGRLPVLLMGYIAFAAVYLGWAVANQGWNAWILFLIYGVYAAATEGVGKAMVADLIPRERRGLAFGWFAGLTGLAALPSNIIGGVLWSEIGPSATFLFGAAVAGMAAVCLLGYSLFFRGRTRPAPSAGIG